MANYNEFIKLYNRIKETGRLNKVWFIVLRPFNKRPIEGSWLNDNKHLNIYQIEKLMKKGYNIGVVALPDGIMIIDIDTDDKGNLLSKDIVNALDCCNTFTVKTRSNGLHFYFLNNNKFNTQDIKENNIVIGEIRSNISYVLASGCCVEDYEQKYTVIQDKPIRELPDSIIKLLSVEITDNLTTAKPQLKGKLGKPISEKHKAMIEAFKKRV